MKGACEKKIEKCSRTGPDIKPKYNILKPMLLNITNIKQTALNKYNTNQNNTCIVENYAHY